MQMSWWVLSTLRQVTWLELADQGSLELAVEWIFCQSDNCGQELVAGFRENVEVNKTKNSGP